MSWDDIDFDLIVKGMITRGPAQVSFGEYMQQFSRALDERWNMITTDFVNFPIPNIQFETGEIRNDVFYDKFKELIEGYHGLWFGFGPGRRTEGRLYYDKGVLDDTSNSEDYRLTDDDLELAMGPEAWNIFDNIFLEDFPFNETWKASIFQAFFIVYEFTNVRLYTRLEGNSAVQNTPVTLNFSGDYYEAAAVPFSLGRNYADTLAALTWVLTNPVNPSNSIAFFSFLARGGVRFGENWTIRPFNETATNDLRNKNGLSVILQCKDLDDNILDMNYNSFSVMNSNEFTDNHTTNPTPPFTTEIISKKFNEDFDFLEFFDSVQIETPIDNISQTPDGTKQDYKVSGGSPLQPLDLIDTTAQIVNNRQIFFISEPASHFVELNNSALEFFIDPIP